MSAIEKEILAALRVKLAKKMQQHPESDEDYGRPEAVYFEEGRGFYPRKMFASADYLSNGYFQPWNSFFHEASGTDGIHRQHKGLDICAPYQPFPYEVPVCAIVNGTIYNRTYRGDFSEKASADSRNLGTE